MVCFFFRNFATETNYSSIYQTMKKQLLTTAILALMAMNMHVAMAENYR